MPLKPINTKDRLEKIKTDPQSAYLYSKKILKERWPEAEPYIMQDPFYAYVYALYVIKDKWPEAEPTIKKDKEIWNYYRSYFKIKGRV